MPASLSLPFCSESPLSACRSRLAHRGYVMETSTIALEGTAEELADDPQVQRVYLGGWPGHWRYANLDFMKSCAIISMWRPVATFIECRMFGEGVGHA